MTYLGIKMKVMSMVFQAFGKMPPQLKGQIKEKTLKRHLEFEDRTRHT